jgi:hypothetical protein
MIHKRMSAALLSGFDWKLHFVVASDSAAAVNAPLLRLQLFLAGARAAARSAARSAETPKAPEPSGSDAPPARRARRRGARRGALARAA